MKEVFEGSLWEAEVVKGLLQSVGISCLLRDETMGAVTSPYLTLGGIVKILVQEDDFENAKQIIASRE
ncbi:MAG: DUF2007 domain-containing protein [Bacteroidaceae bacterium]|nr:DUF2007 domain-containing protein [Bacteroidaceae bacterium]